MKIKLLVLCLGFVLGLGLLVAGCSSSSSGGGSTSTFTLTSTSWTNAGAIPDANAYTVMTGGLNKSPQLTFSNIPTGTLSFAIIMKDGSGDTYKHWRVINIPVDTTTLIEDVSSIGIAGATQLNSDLVTAGYEGPWPPVGTSHTYTITVYALNTASVSLSADISNADFITGISAYSLDSASYTGTYTGK